LSLITSKSILTVDTVSENLEYATLAVNLFSTFQIVVFVVMVLIYPPYPAPFSIEKYIVKRGFESAVSEFQLVRKILYVAIPLLIFFTVIEFLKPLIECILLCKRISISNSTGRIT
jgi:hypothetical protein